MAKIMENREKKVAVLLGDPRKPDSVKKGGVFNQEDIEAVDRLKEALGKLREYEFIYFDNHETLEMGLKDLRGRGIDYAFNLCDEGFFNDPSREKDIPLVLEKLGIPYTGARAECMILCYDKSQVKELARKRGIPTPKNYHLNEDAAGLRLEFPLIVKPVCGDGGFGITKESVVNNQSELEKALLTLRGKFSYKKRVMLEEFLSGDEISVGIIGNTPHSYEILPFVKEDYSSLPPDLPKICGHEAKWDPESPYWKFLTSIPADLPEQTRRAIEENSVKLFECLKCRDYARFDWRFNSSGRPKLLEVNPNPGWCWDGHLAKMAGLGNISYPKMLEKILKAAEKRIFGSE